MIAWRASSSFSISTQPKPRDFPDALSVTTSTPHGYVVGDSTEQYPTGIRETGVGLFEGVGRFFGGALAPYIMAFILTGGSVLVSYLFVALVALVGISAVAVLGTETKGLTVDY